MHIFQSKFKKIYSTLIAGCQLCHYATTEQILWQFIILQCGISFTLHHHPRLMQYCCVLHEVKAKLHAAVDASSVTPLLDRKKYQSASKKKTETKVVLSVNYFPKIDI